MTVNGNDNEKVVAFLPEYENHPGCDMLRAIKNKVVFIVTFGCTYNHGDSRKLSGILIRQGCRLVDSPDHADLVIVNSCTVIEKTARKVLRAIASFHARDIYVTGCMPAAEPDRIGFSNAVFIPPACIQEVYRQSRAVLSGSPGIVQIAQGCLGRCRYCITRFARGKLRSFPKEEIIREVEGCVHSGAAEIQLTAQDVSSWGTDTNETLPDLLGDLVDIPGNFRIRVGMMNPGTLKNIVPGLVTILEHEKLFKFIHMPVQSGSDRILDQMGRGYGVKDTVAIMKMIRQKHPDISLMTDIIVGFPGETEGDFQASLALIREIMPNKVNITRYSKRARTESAKLPDLTDYLKKTRSRQMNGVAENIYHEINAEWLGKIVPFIVTEKIREGSVVTRSPSYLDIIQKEDLPVGTTGKVHITEERTYYFLGDRVL
ncbi:MAG TPA: MiaB/RimO family radical SAM methylthiotransferase [Methanoregulaceae archaeon]|nr:MiaB/RimO family radical SAM methylthiotransferase [Methanoregulaceae archaeon]